MSNIASEINNGLGAFKALYDIGKLALTKAKTRFSTPLRVEKLADDVFSSNIKYGSVVTVEGVLTRYSTTYRPTTYAPTIPAQSSDKQVGFEKDIKTGQIFQKRETTAKFKTFQFPVQTLPKFTDSTGSYSVAFIYPKNFNSFLLNSDKNKKDINDVNDKLIIESINRPIPIIISEEALENFSESIVTITGIVSMLPQSLIETFTNSICKTRENFFNNFLRPYSAKMAFCLDCRDKINSDFLLNEKLTSLPAALYIEGHFEGITDKKHQNEFKESIPKGLYWSFAYGNYPGKTFYLSEDDAVSVMGLDPSIFGFYIEANLADQRNLEAKIRSLEGFYTQFRKTASNRIRKNTGTEARFKPDFIFDYRKQFIFHPQGVLTSSESNRAIENNPSILDTAKWLQSAK